MVAHFFVYDTVDDEVVSVTVDWPGAPRSVYRPVYWKGSASTWWKFLPTHDGVGSDKAQIHADCVPEVVRLAHMVT